VQNVAAAPFSFSHVAACDAVARCSSSSAFATERR
jgi:hypothetical protein